MSSTQRRVKIIKKKLYLITLNFVVILLLSCENNISKQVTSLNYNNSQAYYAPISITDMPSSSISELNSIYHNDSTNVIHYNVARLIATAELLGGANVALGVNIDDPWYLTPYPKIIYNINNTPKYYEFGYVVNSQIVATVTTFATKEIAGVIAFLFKDPLNYDCPDYDYYVGDYPNRYYGKDGRCYLRNCNEEIEGELNEVSFTEEEKFEEMIELMGGENFDAISQDLSDNEGSFDDVTNERDDYWEQIDELISTNYPFLLSNNFSFEEPLFIILDNFKNIEDDEEFNDIENSILLDLIELFDYEVGYFNIYKLPEYSNPYLQRTHWTGDCGPAACAWVYRGKFNTYKNYYLPIYNDTGTYNNFYNINTTNYNYGYYNFFGVDHSSSLNSHTALYNFTTRSNEADNGLTAVFYNNSTPFIYNGYWQFPIYHDDLCQGFKSVTGGQYTVKFTCKPYIYLHNNNEPLIIAINCDHYIVAFGTGVTLTKNGSVKDKYFIVTDNGVTTAPSYEPYMRRVNLWNLHYGLKKY